MDSGSSVTLIFYKVGDDWYRGGEPILNLIAAAAQGSSFTHVEIAIGEDEGRGGRMKNVLRVFNDNVGVVSIFIGIPTRTRTYIHIHALFEQLFSCFDPCVYHLFGIQELAERTGINPSYSYVQIGCSKAQEQAMLAFARRQVGKPFSSVGMARALVWPRKTDGTSWFCAELVAACLQSGGLMSQSSSPGSATPSSLYKIYKNCGAVAANPCTLRRQRASSESFASGSSSGSTLNVLRLNRAYPSTTTSLPLSIAAFASGGGGGGGGGRGSYAPVATQSASPPRMSFRQMRTAPVQRRAAPVQTSRMIPLSFSNLTLKR